MAFRWLDKVERNVSRGVQAATIAHGAYQAGKMLWAGAQAVAPYAAMLL